MKPQGRPARRIAGLRRLREARHLTLEDVVRGTGLSRSWLERLEYGNVRIGMEAGIALAMFYGLTLKEIEQAQAQSRQAKRRKA